MSRPARAERFWGGTPHLWGLCSSRPYMSVSPRCAAPVLPPPSVGQGRPAAPQPPAAPRPPARPVPLLQQQQDPGGAGRELRYGGWHLCSVTLNPRAPWDTGPFHPCAMACVALGTGSHQSPRCYSYSCLGALGRSVGVGSLTSCGHFRWLVLQTNPGCHCPLSGGRWFGHLVEWQCSVREELLGISATWLPGISVTGPCPCTEQRHLFLWLPSSCFQVPGCILVLFPAGHGCNTQGELFG